MPAAVQDAVAVNQGIGRQGNKGTGPHRGNSAKGRVTLEERRRRAAAIMVRDFRKGRLGRLTFDAVN